MIRTILATHPLDVTPTILSSLKTVRIYQRKIKCPRSIAVQTDHIRYENCNFVSSSPKGDAIFFGILPNTSNNLTNE